MDFINDKIPRNLSSRLWLITLPSAVFTFERRSDVPKLPATPARILGGLLIMAGVGVGIVAAQNPETTISYNGPGQAVARKPALIAGLVTLLGIALLLRSTMLALYTIAIAIAGGTDRVTLEEPSSHTLTGDGG